MYIIFMLIYIQFNYAPTFIGLGSSVLWHTLVLDAIWISVWPMPTVWHNANYLACEWYTACDVTFYIRRITAPIVTTLCPIVLYIKYVNVIMYDHQLCKLFLLKLLTFLITIEDTRLIRDECNFSMIIYRQMYRYFYVIFDRYSIRVIWINMIIRCNQLAAHAFDTVIWVQQCEAQLHVSLRLIAYLINVNICLHLLSTRSDVVITSIMSILTSTYDDVLIEHGLNVHFEIDITFQSNYQHDSTELFSIEFNIIMRK